MQIKLISQNFKNYFFVYTVIVLALLETECSTFLVNDFFNPASISIIYFVSGISLSVLALYKVTIQKNPVSNYDNKKTYIFFKKYLTQRNFLFLIFAFVFLYFTPIVHKFLSEAPINYHSADMIPVLKKQAGRFLSGENIYDVIPEIWGGMKPVYLTFMWLPFTVSEYFNFDARWIVLVWIVSGIYFCLSVTRYSKIKPASFIAAAGLFLIINHMVTQDQPTIVNTEEGIVMGYYLFLGYALSKKNTVLISLGIAFCVLSRYVLFFWLPVFWLYWYFFQSKRQAWYILAISTALIFFLFLLPFGFKDLKFFLNLHEGYIGLAQRTWRNDPEFTWQTLGFAKFFGAGSIPLLHTTLLISAAAAPVLFFLFFIFMRKSSSINSEMFALCALKLTMVVFYNFLEMPYFYLFYTSTLFSYIVVFNFCKSVEIIGKS